MTPVSRSVSDPLETGRRDGCGDRDRDSRRAVGAQVQRQVRPEVAQLRTAGEGGPPCGLKGVGLPSLSSAGSGEDLCRTELVCDTSLPFLPSLLCACPV